MSKRMTDRERLKLAMDQPDTIGGTDWIGWLEIVIREMNKDADHIRALEDRILLAKRLNYANYPGFVNPALNGEAIPQDILEYTDRICMEEGCVARVNK